MNRKSSTAPISSFEEQSQQQDDDNKTRVVHPAVSRRQEEENNSSSIIPQEWNIQTPYFGVGVKVEARETPESNFFIGTIIRWKVTFTSRRFFDIRLLNEKKTYRDVEPSDINLLFEKGDIVRMRITNSRFIRGEIVDVLKYVPRHDSVRHRYVVKTSGRIVGNVESRDLIPFINQEQENQTTVKRKRSEKPPSPKKREKLQKKNVTGLRNRSLSL